MNWSNGLHCHEFNDDLIFNQQVDPLSDLELMAFVDNWQGYLGGDPESALPQFESKAGLIGAFK